jgi:hypothetical protein
MASILDPIFGDEIDNLKFVSGGRGKLFDDLKSVNPSYTLLTLLNRHGVTLLSDGRQQFTILSTDALSLACGEVAEAPSEPAVDVYSYCRDEGLPCFPFSLRSYAPQCIRFLRVNCEQNLLAVCLHKVVLFYEISALIQVGMMHLQELDEHEQEQGDERGSGEPLPLDRFAPMALLNFDSFADFQWSSMRSNEFVALSDGVVARYRFDVDGGEPEHFAFDLGGKPATAVCYEPSGHGDLFVGFGDGVVASVRSGSGSVAMEYERADDDDAMLRRFDVHFLRAIDDKSIAVGMRPHADVEGPDDDDRPLFFVYRENPDSELGYDARRFDFWNMRDEERAAASTVHIDALASHQLIVVGGSDFGDVEVVADPSGNGPWVHWLLEDKARVSYDSMHSDNFTAGFAFDTTQTHRIVSDDVQEQQEGIDLPPQPRLISLATDGVVYVYHLVHAVLYRDKPAPSIVAPLRFARPRRLLQLAAAQPSSSSASSSQKQEEAQPASSSLSAAPARASADVPVDSQSAFEQYRGDLGGGGSSSCVPADFDPVELDESTGFGDSVDYGTASRPVAHARRSWQEQRPQRERRYEDEFDESSESDGDDDNDDAERAAATPLARCRDVEQASFERGVHGAILNVDVDEPLPLQPEDDPERIAGELSAQLLDKVSIELDHLRERSAALQEAVARVDARRQRPSKYPVPVLGQRVQALAGECSSARTAGTELCDGVLSAMAAAERARSLIESARDPTYQYLLDSRKLDAEFAATRRHLRERRSATDSLVERIETQLEAIVGERRRLERERAERQDREQLARRARHRHHDHSTFGSPMTAAAASGHGISVARLYEIMTHHHNTIESQAAKLERAQRQIRKLARAHGRRIVAAPRHLGADGDAAAASAAAAAAAAGRPDSAYMASPTPRPDVAQLNDALKTKIDRDVLAASRESRYVPRVFASPFGSPAARERQRESAREERRQQRHEQHEQRQHEQQQGIGPLSLHSAASQLDDSTLDDNFMSPPLKPIAARRGEMPPSLSLNAPLRSITDAQISSSSFSLDLDSPSVHAQQHSPNAKRESTVGGSEESGAFQVAGDTADFGAEENGGFQVAADFGTEESAGFESANFDTEENGGFQVAADFGTEESAGFESANFDAVGTGNFKVAGDVASTPQRKAAANAKKESEDAKKTVRFSVAETDFSPDPGQPSFAAKEDVDESRQPLDLPPVAATFDAEDMAELLARATSLPRDTTPSAGGGKLGRSPSLSTATFDSLHDVAPAPLLAKGVDVPPIELMPKQAVKEKKHAPETPAASKSKSRVAAEKSKVTTVKLNLASTFDTLSGSGFDTNNGEDEDDDDWGDFADTENEPGEVKKKATSRAAPADSDGDTEDDDDSDSTDDFGSDGGFSDLDSSPPLSQPRSARSGKTTSDRFGGGGFGSTRFGGDDPYGAGNDFDDGSAALAAGFNDTGASVGDGFASFADQASFGDAPGDGSGFDRGDNDNFGSTSFGDGDDGSGGGFGDGGSDGDFGSTSFGDGGGGGGFGDGGDGGGFGDGGFGDGGSDGGFGSTSFGGDDGTPNYSDTDGFSDFDSAPRNSNSSGGGGGGDLWAPRA